MKGEQILVVPRDKLFARGHLQGFSDDPATVAHFLQAVTTHGRFVPRRPAEEDEVLKQIVPYGVVLYKGRVFLFQRGQKGTEAGLRGRWSIGLGGHVNPKDGDEITPNMLRRALLREIGEEVALEAARPGPWGVLNDDQDPVGRRHFGFVYRVEVAAPSVRSREPGKIRGSFASTEEARSQCGGMETWSRIIFRALAR